MVSDNEILKYLDKHQVKYELVTFKKAQQVIELYSKPRLVIGMRGHAQMIPFGCHTPILSIVSHDKMQWFLDDIEHPEWGVDVLDDDFEDKLFQKASDFYENYDNNMRIIDQQQEKLWEVTCENLKTIDKIF